MTEDGPAGQRQGRHRPAPRAVLCWQFVAGSSCCCRGIYCRITCRKLARRPGYSCFICDTVFCVLPLPATVSCKLQSVQRGPLHLAATVHLGLQSDPYFTTQNQVEVFTTGTLQRARLPLEATIRITPTMQLTNGLPYDVLGWAIAPPHKEAAAGGAAAAATAAAAAAKAAPADSGMAAVAAAAAGAMGSEGSETGGAPPAAVTGRGSIELQATPGGGAAGAGGRLAGLQQVWAAVSKKEAELALARLVAGGWQHRRTLLRCGIDTSCVGK